MNEKSFLAGILVGIGGFAFLSVSSDLLGSFLFCIGLLAIIIQEYNLYTGKVGYIRKIKEIPNLLKILFFNFLGVFVIGLLGQIFLKEQAVNLVNYKMTLPLCHIFIKSILCGMMIYLAVELYKKTYNFLAVIIPIMVFILCKFEHSIANMFYFFVAGIINLKSLVLIFITIIGNAIGSLVISFLENK